MGKRDPLFGERFIIHKHRVIRGVACLIIIALLGLIIYAASPPSKAQVEAEMKQYEKELRDRWQSVEVEVKPANSGLTIEFEPHAHNVLAWTIHGDTSRFSSVTFRGFKGKTNWASVQFNFNQTSCRGTFDPDVITRMEVEFNPKR